MPEPYKLDTPGAISGADISSATDGAGVLFYSYQMAVSGQPPVQAVRRRLPNGTTEPIALPLTVTGRGQLCVDGGALWLTAWQEVGPKTGWRIPIAEWVPVVTRGDLAPEGIRSPSQALRDHLVGHVDRRGRGLCHRPARPCDAR